MEKLWAPWRLKYIRSKKTKGCLFCNSLQNKSKNYIILESRHSFSMLNIYPYNNGHSLISPKRHVKSFAQLKDNEALDLIRSLKNTQKLLNKVLKPEGYNIGINENESAGAGIAGHLHLHIVPRWKGDTNFMPVLNNTKIISQALDELYRQLKRHVRPEAD